MVKALVCETRDWEFKSPQPPRMKYQNQIKIGGEVVTHQLADRVAEVLKEFDRLYDPVSNRDLNPDREFLRKVVREQVGTDYCRLNLVVFVCPDTDQAALTSTNPERFFPDASNRGDLFQPRVRKILDLREQLWRAGVIVVLNFLIGDNGADYYLFPFLKGLKIDRMVYQQRRREYYSDFQRRVEEEFGGLITVISFADLGVGLYEERVNFSAEELEVELVKRAGDYEETFKAFGVDRRAQEEMVRLKRLAYLEQGLLLEAIGGVLLQTELPWLAKTWLLRSPAGDSRVRSIPAIYPWIRKEELKEMMRGE